jgi:hypothetical protein
VLKEKFPTNIFFTIVLEMELPFGSRKSADDSTKTSGELRHGYSRIIRLSPEVLAPASRNLVSSRPLARRASSVVPVGPVRLFPQILHHNACFTHHFSRTINTQKRYPQCEGNSDQSSCLKGTALLEGDGFVGRGRLCWKETALKGRAFRPSVKAEK